MKNLAVFDPFLSGWSQKTDSRPDFRLTRSWHPSASGRRIGLSPGDGWADRRDPKPKRGVFYEAGLYAQSAHLSLPHRGAVVVAPPGSVVLAVGTQALAWLSGRRIPVQKPCQRQRCQLLWLHALLEEAVGACSPSPLPSCRRRLWRRLWQPALPPGRYKQEPAAGAASAGA
jgi:hypothetical protein